MATRLMRLLLANGWGSEVESPSIEQMCAFLSDADPDDVEHGDVSLEATDLSPDTVLDEAARARTLSTSLAWTEGRLVLWTTTPHRARHLPEASRDDVLRLWTTLAAQRFGDLEREPWVDGDGGPSPEEREAHLRRVTLQLDREFFDLPGSSFRVVERPPLPFPVLRCEALRTRGEKERVGDTTMKLEAAGGGRIQ